MDNKKLANLLFPNVTKTIEDYLKQYPERNLPQGAEVLRFAPSPTGFVHLGNLFSAVIDYTVARQTKGVFYFRLEDTDTKREIEGAADYIYKVLTEYGITPNEGFRGEKLPSIGDYGPYVQTERVEIYQTFVKHLVATGNAFPCFCEKAENKKAILERREEELKIKDKISEKDCCRDLLYEEIEANIKQSKPFAIRLRSKGNGKKTRVVTDLFKGKRKIRENAKDIILIKSDGIPPYALAHLVDDVLMRTTIVVRGDEWYASLASHIELFEAAGFKPLKYGHAPLICTLDQKTGNKRKLSKRLDPHFFVSFFSKAGYPKDAVIEYLLFLANSNFEPWRMQNPDKHYSEFEFSLSKVGSNNPMFDFVKLNDIAKNAIAKMSATEVFDNLASWAKEHDKEFYSYLTKNKEYVTKVFAIERGTNRARKDIAKWDEVKTNLAYMFNKPTTFEIENLDNEILNAYAKVFDINDDKDIWFGKIKDLANKFNYCTDNKEYKQNPQNYKGNTTDFVTIIRVAITGMKNSPDIYEITNVLGKDETINRLIRSKK